MLKSVYFAAHIWKLGADNKVILSWWLDVVKVHGNSNSAIEQQDLTSVDEKNILDETLDRYDTLLFSR